MTRPFGEYWKALRGELSRPRRIPNWSRDGLIRDGDFEAVMTGSRLHIELDDGRQREVYLTEAEKVYSVWSEYVSGLIPRSRIVHEMGVVNSKYIISVFHQFQHLM